MNLRLARVLITCSILPEGEGSSVVGPISITFKRASQPGDPALQCSAQLFGKDLNLDEYLDPRIVPDSVVDLTLEAQRLAHVAHGLVLPGRSKSE